MSPRPFTRRRLLTAAAAGGAAVAVGGYELGRSEDPRGGGAPTVPFHGAHQAGIATTAQDHLHFAAFDVTSDDVADLRELMRGWTDAAARMTAGELAGSDGNAPLAPPADTGEALGLKPAQLTLTFGFGPSLFEHQGQDRFGLARMRPSALRTLPPLPGDELDPDLSGGDLCVQACSNDPQVAFHAVRNLARLGRGTVVMRWSQLGFGRTSTTSETQSAPRNLMGFKDGTNNIRSEDVEAMNDHVWIGPGELPAWMRGGTFAVTRRIRMLIEVWDRASLQDQERTIGRRKVTGAPFGGTRERDPVRPRELPAKSHVRLAGPTSNGGERILRRGYSFTDGLDPELGQLDAGLFFIAFQRDPERQFAAIQRRLGSNDALNEYITHTSSAVFAVPGGVRQGQWVGQGLLG